MRSMPPIVETKYPIPTGDLVARDVWAGMRQILEDMIIHGRCSPHVGEIIKSARRCGWSENGRAFLIGLPSAYLVTWGNAHLAAILSRAIVGFVCREQTVEFCLVKLEVTREPTHV
jgi:hypothetical protein